MRARTCVLVWVRRGVDEAMVRQWPWENAIVTRRGRGGGSVEMAATVWMVYDQGGWVLARLVMAASEGGAAR
mgnify:CR=1 FL=1